MPDARTTILLRTPVRVVDQPLLRCTLVLYPDRLCLEGRTRTLRPYGRSIPLEAVVRVEWSTLDEPHNLLVHLAGEVLRLRVPGAAQWKFAIEGAFPNVGRAPVGLPMPSHAGKAVLRDDERPRPVRARADPQADAVPQDAKPPTAFRPTAPASPGLSPNVLALLDALEGAEIASVQVHREGELLVGLHLAGKRLATLVVKGTTELRIPLTQAVAAVPAGVGTPAAPVAMAAPRFADPPSA